MIKKTSALTEVFIWQLLRAQMSGFLQLYIFKKTNIIAVVNLDII